MLDARNKLYRKNKEEEKTSVVAIVAGLQENLRILSIERANDKYVFAKSNNNEMNI